LEEMKKSRINIKYNFYLSEIVGLQDGKDVEKINPADTQGLFSIAVTISSQESSNLQ